MPEDLKIEKQWKEGRNPVLIHFFPIFNITTIMLSNLNSGKRLFPLFDFTTGFGAFPARLRTNDQMTVGCLLRSLRLPKTTNLRFFDRRILPPIMFLFDT